MSPVSATTPPWRQPSWLDDPAAGPQRNDSRGGWAERTWGLAGTWLGLLERRSLDRLPWRHYPPVFGEKTFKAMIETREAAQALVERFGDDESITVAQVIATVDKYVEVWSQAIHEAKAAGRLRGKTVRVLTWCS